MKRSELKKILKPLIKECIREVILEESGILARVVSEVANGLTTAAPTAQVVVEKKRDIEHEQYLQKLQEVKQQKHTTNIILDNPIIVEQHKDIIFKCFSQFRITRLDPHKNLSS